MNIPKGLGNPFGQWPKLRERIFMSGKLHDALVKADTGIDFRFKKVRIV